MFDLRGIGADGQTVPVRPAQISIVHGATIGDPPLSRTIGVAQADNHVQVYFERGTPLPCRRTFSLETVETVAPSSAHSLVRIPIVQGEQSHAHLCRLVGALEIEGARIKSTLPVGSRIELTLSLDRGGQLSASAYIPNLDQVFDEVAHLMVPAADLETMLATAEVMQARISRLQDEALVAGLTVALGRLNGLATRLKEARRDLGASRGGDEDAGQRARRAMLDIDGELESIEMDRRWPELEQERLEVLTWVGDEVSEHGQPRERKMFNELAAAADEALAMRDAGGLERNLRLLRRLGTTCYFRGPGAWESEFEYAASKIESCPDLPRARRLVQSGRAALSRGDRSSFQDITRQLQQLTRVDPEKRHKGFDSGVR